jgi:hypothetical protein
MLSGLRRRLSPVRALFESATFSATVPGPRGAARPEPIVAAHRGSDGSASFLDSPHGAALTRPLGIAFEPEQRREPIRDQCRSCLEAAVAEWGSATDRASAPSADHRHAKHLSACGAAEADHPQLAKQRARAASACC